MKARWFVEIAITSLGLIAVAACAQGTSTIGNGQDGDGGDDWAGASSSSGKSSSNGAGGGSSSNGAGGGGGAASSSASSASSASSSSSSGVCMETPCRLVSPQCGCAPGQMCEIDGSSQGTRICVAAGTVTIGGQCMNDNCAPGGLCVGPAGGITTCAKYCSSDADCPAPGGLCIIGLNDGSSGQIPGVKLCTENCNPATNVGCSVSGTSCHVVKESMGQMRSLTQCLDSGAGTQGTACSDSADCAATFGCFNAGTSQCLKYCVVGGAACPGGATCNSFNPKAIIGGTEYGACL